MGLTRTFEGFAPPARYDEDPFTKAILQESEERDAGFEEVELFALDPVDEDPANPAARDFTTDSATLAEGWYRFVWEDASGDTFTTPAFHYPSLPAWAPSIDDVAVYVRARTRDAGGTLAGTFNAATVPTGAEVEHLISQAVDHVASGIGAEPCKDALRRSAGVAAALYAAVLLEVGYYPESTNNAQSSATRLEALFDKRMKTLESAVAEECGGQGTGGAGGDGNAGALARGHFSDGEYLIGRDWPEAW